MANSKTNSFRRKISINILAANLLFTKTIEDISIFFEVLFLVFESG
ncbi:unnamed protein product [Moneuplotes crassus]|uniref:Uncharacterized protein n=1 Tax=Euplotes crassus TaxID=5936 RepID=A0AAD1XF68_EUPCR|nr:unnamed protein product [Moneuplotes crassus]